MIDTSAVIGSRFNRATLAWAGMEDSNPGCVPKQIEECWAVIINHGTKIR